MSFLLERPRACSTLIRIYTSERPVCIQDLAPVDKPFWRTVYVRLHEFHVAGIIEFTVIEGGEGDRIINLTEKGRIIAGHLFAIFAQLEDD